MTWLGLIKLKLAEEKAKGKAPSIGDVTQIAKKEWVQIKEGKHPLYIQGKAQTYARKNKGENKTKKNKGTSRSSSPGSRSSSPGSSSSLQELLAEIKLCGKCKKKVEKAMKKKGMKGGAGVADSAASVQDGGLGCACGGKGQNGGTCTTCSGGI